MSYLVREDGLEHGGQLLVPHVLARVIGRHHGGVLPTPRVDRVVVVAGEAGGHGRGRRRSEPTAVEETRQGRTLAK
jgi:hypothetical protein